MISYSGPLKRLVLAALLTVLPTTSIWAQDHKPCEQQWREFESHYVGRDPFEAFHKVTGALPPDLQKGLREHAPETIKKLLFLKEINSNAEAHKILEINNDTPIYPDILSGAMPDGLEAIQNKYNLSETKIIYEKATEGMKTRDERLVKNMAALLRSTQARSPSVWNIVFVGGLHVSEYFQYDPKLSASYVNQPPHHTVSQQDLNAAKEVLDRSWNETANLFDSLIAAFETNIHSLSTQSNTPELGKTLENIQIQLKVIKARRADFERSYFKQTNIYLTPVSSDWITKIYTSHLVSYFIGTPENPNLEPLSTPNKALLISDFHHRRDPELADSLPEARCITERGIQHINLGLEAIPAKNKKSLEVYLTYAKALAEPTLDTKNIIMEMNEERAESAEPIEIDRVIYNTNLIALVRKLQEYEREGVEVQLVDLESEDAVMAESKK